jgi:hypothetical protein
MTAIIIIIITGIRRRRRRRRRRIARTLRKDPDIKKLQLYPTGRQTALPMTSSQYPSHFTD